VIVAPPPTSRPRTPTYASVIGNVRKLALELALLPPLLALADRDR
jgi:hypothetical protein